MQKHARQFVAFFASLLFISSASIAGLEESMNEGADAFYAENFTDAIEHFSTAIDIDPSFPEVYILRGMSYHGLDEYELAIIDYDMAIAMDPGIAIVYAQRAFAFHSLSEFGLAITDCSTAITLDPELTVAYLQRASAYKELGELEHAVSDYDMAVSLDAESAELYVLRAMVNYELGLNELVTFDLSTAIELDPGNAVAYRSRGWIQHAQGEYYGAIADYRRALELIPTDYNTQYNLACTYALLGDASSAIEALEVAVSLGYSNLDWMEEDPDFDQVREQPVFQEGMDRIREVLIRTGLRPATPSDRTAHRACNSSQLTMSDLAPEAWRSTIYGMEPLPRLTDGVVQ